MVSVEAKNEEILVKLFAFEGFSVCVNVNSERYNQRCG